mgnify:CR=1 FL=1
MLKTDNSLSSLDLVKTLGTTVLVSLALYIIARNNYLLFHSIAEGFSIIVAALIYVLATRTYRYSGNNFLLFLGIAYLFISVFDFVHILTYKGMGVFPGYDTNTPTQLWIAGRYVGAFSFLFASFFVRHRFSRTAAIWAYGLVTALLLVSIMWVKVFPACYVENKGLTDFKIASEYVICLIILGAIVKLYLQRNYLDNFLYKIIILGMIFNILSEMSFTLYTDVYGFMNFTGHIFKIIAYSLIYWGVILHGMDTPYKTIFKELSESEEKLRLAHLQLLDIIEFLPDATFAIDKDRKVIAWNRAIEEMTGVRKEEMLGEGDYTYSLPFYGEKRPMLIDYVFMDGNNVELKYGNIEKKGPTINAEIFRSSMFGGKGAYHWCTASPLLDSEGNLVGAIESIRDITEHKQVEEKLKSLSTLDGLTGIANRRYFEEYLERELRHATRNAEPISLIICDIDFFKLYNDNYGHINGDECLKKVAATIKNTIKRPGDLVARYGGEEFAVVLPETNLEGAAVVAETLRANVEAKRIKHEKSEISDFITISLGVASVVPSPDFSPSTLVALADQALYQAKKEGRNKVIIFGFNTDE